MTVLIYQIVEIVFGGGMANSVKSWMDSVWSALISLFNEGDLINDAFIVFSGIGAALLILYFLIELSSKASMDMLNLEKFVVMAIKFIIAFLFILYAKEIMNGILQIGSGIYEKVSVSVKDTENVHSLSYYMAHHSGNVNDLDEKGRCKELIKVLEGQYGGFGNFINAISVVIPGLLGLIIGGGCKLLCFFCTTKNAVEIAVRGYMCPLALPQLFEDGQRSAGVRYIKKFAAACLEMAVICVILWLSSELSGYLQESLEGLTGAGNFLFYVDETTKEAFVNIGALDYALSVFGMIPSLLIKLVTAGMIAGTSLITHDIVGG